MKPRLSEAAKRMMKPLFVGQAPGRKAARGARAFSGPGSGARLAKLADMPQHEFLECVDTVNVFKTWRGKSGKGDRFPARRLSVARSAEIVGDAGVVVFVGRAVAAAFGFGDLRPCEWLGPNAMLPHPSGVNRWYNDARNRALASNFLKELINGRQ